VFNNLGQFADMMKSAAKLKESMEEAAKKLGELRVEGLAGGGLVVVTASGKLEIVSVRIDPKLLEDQDAELTEELLLAATNQALAKAREAAAGMFTASAGSLPIPGLSELFKS
jgi:nucleoid-associated protein EbfC